MIGAKFFLLLTVPLTLSVYLLMLSIFHGITIISQWFSLGLVILLISISIVGLLRISEKEEEALLSDHMNIRE